eukprot:CAMPEP_0195250944 /NCGR_PEP_ID=MMETSP0706-20130129/2991_1 /TAXON_ID=33640 /ORGANISM="Asterionellopsis glacialis, Strain CCMP134" /LENGTH=294 /DNA_ID=CAMNT_0040302991 /DNA_START=35 /DNA_END=916 /DNA_ORIENTATION=-
MGDIETPSYLSDDKVQLLWNRFRRWNSVAVKKREDIEFWRRMTLICTISGSICTTLASQLSGDLSWGFSLFGGLILGVIPQIKQNQTSPTKVDEWIRSRTVAEHIKGQIYLYRAGVKPYDKSSMATQTLMDKIDEIDDDAQDLRQYYVICVADGKPAPPMLDRNAYIDLRVKPQIENFFRREAKRLATRGRRFDLLIKFLTVLAATVGFIVGSSGGMESGAGDASGTFMTIIHYIANNLGVWVAVITTASAALSAQIGETNPYEKSALYSNAAQHLEDLYLTLDDETVPGTPEW